MSIEDSMANVLGMCPEQRISFPRQEEYSDDFWHRVKQRVNVLYPNRLIFHCAKETEDVIIILRLS